MKNKYRKCAHRCVYNSEDVKDRYVLITGGAGRVGHYCIQWAKKAGAIVIATSSNNKGRQDCKQAGADIILSHPSETFKEEILELTKGQKIDKIMKRVKAAYDSFVSILVSIKDAAQSFIQSVEENKYYQKVRDFFSSGDGDKFTEELGKVDKEASDLEKESKKLEKEVAKLEKQIGQATR